MTLCQLVITLVKSGKIMASLFFLLPELVLMLKLIHFEDKPNGQVGNTGNLCGGMRPLISKLSFCTLSVQSGIFLFSK